jgi:hypothetical protein
MTAENSRSETKAQDRGTFLRMTAENCRSKTEDPDMHPFGLLRAALGRMTAEN